MPWASTPRASSSTWNVTRRCGGSRARSNAATGAARIADVERYLQAAARRLERLPNAVAVDRHRMNAIHELERAYRERLTTSSRPEALREVPWMLEELRVSQFAQGLGTRGPVSSKRIRSAVDDATG